MTKTAKNKEVLGQLFDLVVKQAAGAPKPVATGVPGKEPNSGSVSDKHDTVNQNAVGPEHNTPQHHEQKPSTDPAKPTGGKNAEDAATAVEADKSKAAEAAPDAAATAAADATKVADDKGTSAAADANPSVEKLGQDILTLLSKFANNPVATGVPSRDPKWQAVSDKHDTVDQNAVKPETNPQGYHQKPAKDPSVPVASAKSAEEEKQAAEKAASYELGKLWAELVLKEASERQLEQVKEAGRRDFEVLITNAASQLKQAERKTEKVAAHADAETEKQAEAEGAAAFQHLYKQAQIEQALGQIVSQNEALAAKVAEMQQVQVQKEAEFKAALAAKEAELARIQAEEKEQQKFAAMAAHLEQRLVDRLTREMAPGR